MCPGCGLHAPPGDQGPTWRSASSGCATLYTGALARSYSEAAYRPLHQLLLDTYCAQHPSGKERREVQLMALSLMTLGLFVEGRADPREGPRLHRAMMARPPRFHWLAPPDLHGLTTIAQAVEAASPEDYERTLRRWAREVWTAWATHHSTIRDWTTRALE